MIIGFYSLQHESSNILLDSCLRAKVADFGLSKPMPPLPAEKSYVKVTSFRGTGVPEVTEQMSTWMENSVQNWMF